MKPGPWLCSIIGLSGVLAPVTSVDAQAVRLDGSATVRDGPDLVGVRGGYWAPLQGVVGAQLYGTFLRDRQAVAPAAPVRRYGGGAELDLFRDRKGPFLAVGLEGGIETGGPDDLWASWTAGVGYTVPVLGLHLAGDVRWRGFLSGGPGGVQVAIGLGISVGGGGSRGGRRSPASPVPAPSHATGPAASRLRADVVASARTAMGQPYRYGGQGDGGFDCSGLIQYAYEANGITVPRVSTDQAQVGEEIGRDPGALAPGDILTFSANAGGGRVSHVGLYLGEGRFIHSASSRGVSESRLGPDDPNGAWWYARWVGARRIIRDP
jgi:hypothetical protein